MNFNEVSFSLIPVRYAEEFEVLCRDLKFCQVETSEFLHLHTIGQISCRGISFVPTSSIQLISFNVPQKTFSSCICITCRHSKNHSHFVRDSYSVWSANEMWFSPQKILPSVSSLNRFLDRTLHSSNVVESKRSQSDNTDEGIERFFLCVSNHKMIVEAIRRMAEGHPGTRCSFEVNLI